MKYLKTYEIFTPKRLDRALKAVKVMSTVDDFFKWYTDSDLWFKYVDACTDQMHINGIYATDFKYSKETIVRDLKKLRYEPIEITCEFIDDNEYEISFSIDDIQYDIINIFYYPGTFVPA